MMGIEKLKKTFLKLKINLKVYIILERSASLMNSVLLLK